MNRIGHHFLSRPACSGDQHRGGAGGHQPGHAVHRSHACSLADHGRQGLDRCRGFQRGASGSWRSLPSADGFKQLQRPGAAPLLGHGGIAGFVQQQDIDSREAMMNDLQQFFRVQIRQPAIEQEQLAFAAFQFA